MKTTLRLFAPFLVAAGALSACLPGRDNPNDTSNRPVAALSIENGLFTITQLPDVGACDEPDGSEESFPRGRCLVLSAEGSTDPQGDGDITSWVFELQTNGEGWFAVESSGARAFVEPRRLRSMPVSPQILARVTVTDEAGGSSTADAFFRLENTAPTVPRPGSRFVPHFGAIWDRTDFNGIPPDEIGGPLDVRLSAHAVDAEDDPIGYCWRELSNQPGAPEVSPYVGSCAQGNAFADCLPTDEGFTGATITKTVASAEEDVKSVAFFLQACDGDLWSVPTTAFIELALLPGWGIEDDFDTAFLLDTQVRAYDLTDAIQGIPGFAFRQPGVENAPARAFYGFDDPATPGVETSLVKTLLVGDSSAGAVLFATLPDTVPGPGTPVIREVKPADGGWAWVLAVVGSSGLGVFVVEADGTAHGPLLPSTPLSAAGEQSVLADVNPQSGDLWFSATFASHAIGVEWDGVSLSQIGAVAIDDDLLGHPRMITGLAIHPSTNEPVFMHSGHVLVPGAADPAAVLVRLPNGSTEEWTFDIPEVFADALIQTMTVRGPTFVTEQLAFVHFFGSGTGVVFLDSGTKQARLIAFGETEAIGFQSAVHPKTQRLLTIVSGYHQILRSAFAGEVVRLETARSVDAVYRDAVNERLWSYSAAVDGQPARLTSGSGSASEALLQRFAVPPSFNRARPAIDYSSGDLWTPSFLPAGAARFYADGRLADFIDAVDENGDHQPPFPGFGAAVFLASDPASGALWMVAVQDTSGEANRIFRVDPYATRPLGFPTVVASGGVIGKALEPDETVVDLEATPSVGTSTSGALVLLTRTSSGRFRLRRIFSDATEAAPIELLLNGTLNPPAVRMARDLSSTEEEFCVAVRVTANQIRLYRPPGSLIASAGPELQLAVSEAAIRSIAAFQEECWLSYKDGTEEKLLLWRPDDVGTPTLFLTLPGKPEEIVPEISPETFDPVKRRAWMEFPDEQVLRRIAVRQTSGTPFLEIQESLATKGDVTLLNP